MGLPKVPGIGPRAAGRRGGGAAGRRGGARSPPGEKGGLVAACWAAGFGLEVLGGSFPASLARHPRSPQNPSERTKLNNVLDLRDRLKKKEGIHVLGRRNGGCSAMGLTAGPGGPSNG